jgi:hypothetical protein
MSALGRARWHWRPFQECQITDRTGAALIEQTPAGRATAGARQLLSGNPQDQANLGGMAAGAKGAGQRPNCPTPEPAPNRAKAAQLPPYGGPGGGHHIPSKKALTGAPGYDPSQALAIPNAELARMGVRHELVTGAQMTGYRAFARAGRTLTWEALAQIETQAFIRGGMRPATAQATVQQAIQALKDAGVSGPTRTPWGGQ